MNRTRMKQMFQLSNAEGESSTILTGDLRLMNKRLWRVKYASECSNSTTCQFIAKWQSATRIKYLLILWDFFSLGFIRTLTNKVNYLNFSFFSSNVKLDQKCSIAFITHEFNREMLEMIVDENCMLLFWL